MPAKDRYHDIVVRALIKDGWTIAQEQVYFSDNERHVWVDLSVQRADNESLILIEIKGFENVASEVDSLMAAIGQYAFYKAMLQYLQKTFPLYLAIPLNAYDRIFQTPAAQQAVKNVGIWVMVFNPATEEIVRWVR
jgi:hypothetical protein